MDFYKVTSHHIFAFSLLLLHSFAYNSESPYLVTPVERTGAVGLVDGWLDGKLGLVGCMSDEWHLRRIGGGREENRGKKSKRNGMSSVLNRVCLLVSSLVSCEH